VSNGVSNSVGHRGDGVGHRVGNGMGHGGDGMGYRVGDGMSDDRVSNTDNIRIGSSSVIGDGGNISSDVVSFVVDVLDPAVGEVDRVGARYGASSIVRLSLGEVSAGVVVSHGVLVVVGGRLSQVTRIITSDSVSYGVGNHRVGHNRVGHGVGNGMSHDRMGYGVTHHSVTHEAMRQKLGAGRSHSQESGTDESLHVEV